MEEFNDFAMGADTPSAKGCDAQRLGCGYKLGASLQGPGSAWRTLPLQVRISPYRANPSPGLLAKDAQSAASSPSTRSSWSAAQPLTLTQTRTLT